MTNDPRKFTDAIGRTVWKRRTTPPERARRAEAARKLRAKGASIEQIAIALEVDRQTVNRDLYGRDGEHPGTPRGVPRSLKRQPARVPWRDNDPEREVIKARPTRGAYVNSSTLRMVTNLVEASHEGYHLNMFANDAAEAEEKGDQEWLNQAHVTMTEAIAELMQLREVLVNREARHAGQRDERPTGLRVV